MRNLFDSRKEHKSLKLVKKLQEEADKEWELERRRREQQELDDEAIAKELQAQLEEEGQQQSSPSSSPFSPPPLPVKPSAYNSSSSIDINSSLQTKPTNTSISSTSTATPLYSLSPNKDSPALPPRQQNQQNKKQAYLSYKPELQFSVASPAPEPSTVFYQKTPVISPVSPSFNKPVIEHEKTNRYSMSIPSHMEMPVPTNVNPINHYTPPPIINNSSISRPPFIPPATVSSSSVPTDPIILPLGQQRPQHTHYQSAPPALIPVANPISNFESPSAYYTPPIYPMNNPTTPTTAVTNVILDGNIPQQHTNNTNVHQYASYPQQQTYFESHYSAPSEVKPIPTLNHNPSVVTNQHSNKPLYTNSSFSLKPDEKGVPTDSSVHQNTSHKLKYIPPRPPTPIASLTTAVHSDEEEEEEDDSTKAYNKLDNKDKKSLVEEDQDNGSDDSDWEDAAVDPFADNFSVSRIPKESTATTATILRDDNDDESMKKKYNNLVTTLDSTIKTLDPTIPKKDEKIQQEYEKQERTHAYMEKESEEIENFNINRPNPCPAATPSPAAMTPFFNNPYIRTQQQAFNEEEIPQQKVYPTNILRAGAPPSAEPSIVNNPYYQKQNAVPATDYGYFKEEDQLINKTLPKLPKPTSDEDRHITVESINPGQRVWIRIHPTDTGKLLAERIHIVASYQTRRVTKITTKTGRSIPLDNTPLFDDWNEILNFKDGESWTVEWVPIEHPYMDIITEGREFMKQLKATFRGSS